MRNKKSQMEIMGLAIVVVLIVVGMLFVIRFMMNREAPDYRKEYVPTQLANNFVNTFLNTNARDCKGQAMKDLLEDCAQARSVYCDNGDLSCSYVRGMALEVFSSTLDTWNYDYHFSVYFNEGDEIIPSIGSECPLERKQKTFPISTDLGPLYVTLEICT